MPIITIAEKPQRVKMTEEERKRKNREGAKLYYRLHREEILEKVKRRNDENKEKHLEYRRALRAKNKERKTEADRAWRAKNKEKIRAQMKRWTKTEKGRASNKHSLAIRKARKRGCVSTVTAAQIAELMKSAKQCRYCDIVFTETIRPTLDHIIPLARGGSHSIENLCAACQSCNSKKHAKHPEEWAKQIGRLLI